MDLPPDIKDALSEYKHHTGRIRAFINANGGKTQTARDWDFAPYLVAAQLGDKGVPADLEASLLNAIASRVMVAKYYAKLRDRTGDGLSEVDLRHLSFIDKLRNIKRCWFPAGTKSLPRMDTTAQDSAPEKNEITESPKRAPCRNEDDKRQMFYFDVDAIECRIEYYHLYHPRPIVWSGPESIRETKQELRRLLRNRWPFLIALTDSLGQRMLSREEECGCAYNFTHLSCEDYACRATQTAALEPSLEEPFLDLFHGFLDAPDKMEEFEPRNYNTRPSNSMEAAELVQPAHVWRFFNVTVPSKRSFTLWRCGPNKAHFVNHEIRKFVLRDGPEILNILLFLQHRGDEIVLLTDDRKMYRRLSVTESVDDLVNADTGDFSTMPADSRRY